MLLVGYIFSIPDNWQLVAVVLATLAARQQLAEWSLAACAAEGSSPCCGAGEGGLRVRQFSVK